MRPISDLCAHSLLTSTGSNNILMELRKLLGHPYLVSPDLCAIIVPRAFEQQELTHFVTS